jgi:hypothetical protein
MNSERTSGIGFPDALEQVGRAMYADEWIGELTPTKREEFLITRYVEKYRFAAVPSPTHPIRGREWVEYPDDPALVAEVERARDRMDWREHQVVAANQWLNDHNFRCAPIDSDALARELDRCFSQVSGAPAEQRVIIDDASHLNPTPVTAISEPRPKKDRSRVCLWHRRACLSQGVGVSALSSFRAAPKAPS